MNKRTKVVSKRIRDQLKPVTFPSGVIYLALFGLVLFGVVIGFVMVTDESMDTVAQAAEVKVSAPETEEPIIIAWRSVNCFHYSGLKREHLQKARDCKVRDDGSYLGADWFEAYVAQCQEIDESKHDLFVQEMMIWRMRCERTDEAYSRALGFASELSDPYRAKQVRRDLIADQQQYLAEPREQESEQVEAQLKDHENARIQELIESGNYFIMENESGERFRLFPMNDTVKIHTE